MRDYDGKYYDPYADQDSFEQNEDCAQERESQSDINHKMSDTQKEYLESRGIYGDDIWGQD